MAKQKGLRADGRLQKTITVGKDKDGKLKRLSVYATTQEELDEKVAALRRDVVSGQYNAFNKVTFGALTEQWLAMRKEALSESTHTGYASQFRRHLLPVMGKKNLADLRVEHLSAILSAMLAEGYSTSVMKSVKLCAVGALDYAIENRYIEKNIFESVPVPNGKDASIRTLTEDEVRRIVENPHGHPLCTAALLMLFCGLRRGEAIAIRWEDIDLIGRRVKVYKQIAFEGNLPVEKALEGASTRSVPLPEALRALLKDEHKKSGPICRNKDGEMYSEAALHAAWEGYERFLYKNDPATKRLKNPRAKYQKPRTLYPAMLRQTYAQLLLSSDADLLSAREWLGHGSLEMTCKLYAQVIAKNEGAAYRKLNDHIGQKIGSTISKT